MAYATYKNGDDWGMVDDCLTSLLGIYMGYDYHYKL